MTLTKKIIVTKMFLCFDPFINEYKPLQMAYPVQQIFKHNNVL